MTCRKLFDELMEGVEDMKAHREQKIKLRSYTHEPPPNTVPQTQRKLMKSESSRPRSTS